jgi:hypothetical protein
MREYICEVCGLRGPMSAFQGECSPGWTHGRLNIVTPEPDRQNGIRRMLLHDAQRDIALERQSAVICNSDSVYEPGMRRTLWKLMVGSHAR